jgi:hypothetical protein
MTITLPKARIPKHVSTGKGRKASSRAAVPAGTLPPSPALQVGVSPSPAPKMAAPEVGDVVSPTAMAGQQLYGAGPGVVDGNGSVVEEAGVASVGSPASSSKANPRAAALDH